mmetsp:Transcript_5784/g.7113  ORF Transcript_5784/g.7113 Transcript_5784/m.7113 type:complete len:216 (-) Transcript_5784:2-649(-)
MGSPQSNSIASSCSFRSGRCFTSRLPSRIRRTMFPRAIPCRCSGQFSAFWRVLSLSTPPFSSFTMSSSSIVAAAAASPNPDSSGSIISSLAKAASAMGMTNSSFSIKAEKSELTDLYTVKASRTSSKTNPSPKSSLNHGMSLSRFPLLNLWLSLCSVIIPQALARSAASLSVSDSSFGSAYSFSAGVFASSAARAASNSPLLSKPHVGDVLPISF